MTANNLNALALSALLAGLNHDEAQPTDDLSALAERCSQADILELGQILIDTSSAEGQRLVAAEIRRRLAQW